MNKLFKFLLNKETRFDFLVSKGFYKKISDIKFLKKAFKIKLNQKLDFDNPKTFNQKLQWLKINDRNESYTQMVDKVEAKNFLLKYVSEDHLINTLGVFDNFDSIDFASLPNQFVIKTTHDSGGVVICKDKNTFNIENARRIINRSLKNDYYLFWREFPYKNVKKRIIVESFLSDLENSTVPEYKIFCFNGVCEYVLVCDGKAHSLDRRNTFYDRNMENIIPVDTVFPRRDQMVEKPICLDQMISLSEEIAKKIPFIRVDFYVIKDNFFVGELTFYHNAGFCKFKPSEFDLIFGDKLKIQ